MRFGRIADVIAHYDAIEASPEYAAFFRPDADSIRERCIDASRKPRQRRPSLSKVLAASKRAGVSVASYTVSRDSITVYPGARGKSPLCNGGLPVPSNELFALDLDGSEWN